MRPILCLLVTLFVFTGCAVRNQELPREDRISCFYDTCWQDRIWWEATP